MEPRRRGRDKFDDMTPREREQAILRTRERTTAMLRESVSTLAGTEEVATETLTELDRQGDVIRHAHQMAVETNDDVKTANWMLRGMKSIGGFFRNSLFSKPPEPTARPPARHPTTASSARDARRATAATRDRSPPRTSARAAVDEDDELLDALSGQVSRLREMAELAGTELETQNKELDDIDAVVDDTADGLKKAQRTQRRLIGRH